MPISKKITNLLDRAKVKYRPLLHRRVFTAFDLATTLGEKPDRVAKAVLIRAGRRNVLVVVPAHARLDLTKLAKELKVKVNEVKIATETALGKLPWKPGTTPPFGSLAKVEVVLDRTLAKSKEMIVRTGSLTDSLTMRVKDFIALEQPRIAAIGMRVRIAATRVVRKVKAKRLRPKIQERKPSTRRVAKR